MKCKAAKMRLEGKRVQINPAGQSMRTVVAHQPMARIGTADNIATRAVCLTPDESGFTTAQAHGIDGEWTA